MYKKQLTIKDLYKSLKSKKYDKQVITLFGLVKTNRNMGDIGFISLDDGTSANFVQIVYDVKKHPEYDAIKMGFSLKVCATFSLTPENKQPFELIDPTIEIIGKIDESYPLQKKKTSLDYLRDYPTYRMRTNTFSSVFRVRSALSYAIHNYFHKNNFVYVHTPILTGNDCEGAGEAFKVCTNYKHPDNYFGKEAGLTVSGQLHVEPFALEYQRVYTFGPTFRAEKSQTTRHAAEFWMIEPELAYTHLDGLMDLMEDFLKNIAKDTLKECKDDFEFFNLRIDNNCLKRIKNFIKNPFKRVTYKEGIEILQKAKENGHKFENDDIHFGMDLGSEHERYLAEVHFNCPIFLYDYPKDIKAFYMKQNKDGITVAATDLFVPEIGELCGASEREDDYDALLNIIKAKGLNVEDYQWYLDLRKNGGCYHSGFGLGFERFMMFLTGISNIRDVLPYPRTYKEMKF